MKIYIVRHGETKSNEEGRLQGWSNDVLNDMGVLLAEETGKAMKGMSFDAVISSSLVRARQTAEIILRESGIDAEILFDDRIKEINMGDFEGKRFKPGECEIDPVFVKQFFIKPIETPAFPNGESIRQVMTRTQDFLKELAQKDYESVLVSTHGCALRCMLNFLYDNPDDFWHGHVPYNCCINVVEAEQGKLTLIEDDMVLYDKSLCVDRYSKF
jgi:Fructose-2,6-bisphosphatase